MASGMQLVQTMQQLKEMGADKNIMKVFLSKTMLVDEDLAETYASIVDMQPPQPPQGDNAGGFDDGQDGEVAQEDDKTTQLATDSVMNDIDYSDVVFDSVIGRQGEFVTVNGSIDIGYLNAGGLTKAPIRLKEGHLGMGVIHSNDGHGNQVISAGFQDIEHFIAYVAKNFIEVREGNRPNRWVLDIPRGKKGDMMVVEIEKDEGYYTVITAMIQRIGSINKNKLIAVVDRTKPT